MNKGIIMKNKAFYKLRGTHGMSRALAIAIAVVAVTAVIVSIPTYLYFKSIYKEIDCMSALDTAKRELITAYLTAGGDLSEEEGKKVVTAAMLGWDDLCPGGGVVYIVPTHNDSETMGMPYRLCCGLHDDDKALRTRLNARLIYEYVCDRVKVAKLRELPVPDELTYEINGIELKILRTDENLYLSRGTDFTVDQKGTVAYFGVAGLGDFPADTEADNSGVCYFVYADKDYCASVTGVERWAGNAYGYVYSKDVTAVASDSN